MRSSYLKETALTLIRDLGYTNDPTYIAFDNETTFNNIRTSFPRTPYLLQDPKVDRCDEGYNNGSFRICNHVTEYPFVSSLVTWWVETILINTNLAQYAASHPIHQHGGWYWVVGEGQFPPRKEGSEEYPTVNRTYIEEQYKSGLLQVNDANHAWYGDLDDWHRLPKDVIQVPNNGYVIIRTPLDNPGTWIFHCHIDFHLSIGMGKGKNT